MPDADLTPDAAAIPATPARLLRYFLRLGTTGFGGPIALAGSMQRDLVESRGWFSKADYQEGLAFAQLSPGPLAAQLAMYLGWLRGGWLGATGVGVAFVLPSFLMVLALSALYLHYGSLPFIQSAFYGIAPAVSAIILRSALKLVKTTTGRDWLLGAIFAVLAVSTVWTESEAIGLILLGGVLALLVKAPPKFGASRAGMSVLPGMEWLVTGAHGAVADSTLLTVGTFFLKAGAFVFGSGLAIVPFLYAAVKEYHWLTEQQFVDAVAVAMITPGPVVITSGFIGYVAAGPLGATLATAAVFMPPLLIVIFAAPYYRRFARNPQVKAFVQGVTAAAVGAIAGAAIILTRRAVLDWPTVVIGVVALGILLWKKVPEPVLILTAGAAGILLRGL